MTFICSERRELDNILWLLKPFENGGLLPGWNECFHYLKKHDHNTEAWVLGPVLFNNVNNIKLFYENKEMQVCPQIYIYWFLS